jgi:hypothetical protein
MVLFVHKINLFRKRTRAILLRMHTHTHTHTYTHSFVHHTCAYTHSRVRAPVILYYILYTLHSARVFTNGICEASDGRTDEITCIQATAINSDVANDNNIIIMKFN